MSRKHEHDVPPVVIPARPRSPQGPPEPCPLVVFGECAWWIVGGPIERVVDRVASWLWRGVLP